MTVCIDGIVPVIPVPFDDDERIDEPSLRSAVEFVSTRGMAADVISFALPRQFISTQEDLLRYCGVVADAVSCPVLVQDFNPGGPTVSPDFIATANMQHPNIAYFKLEEPMIIDKLVQIHDKIDDRVGILGGWGGYYMLESLSIGICGVMPGVPMCDLFDRIYQSCKSRDDQQAYDLFASILPYIAFSLQDFELFLQMEKRLMVRRGLFVSSRCRTLTRTISPQVSQHIEFLLDQIEQVIERQCFNAVGKKG